MKKIMLVASTFGFASGAVLGYINIDKAKEEEPPVSEKDEYIDYLYNFANINFDNLKWETNGVITSAEIKDNKFSESIKNNAFADIFKKVNEYKTTSFKIDSVETTFKNETKSIGKTSVDNLNLFIPNIEKDINKITEVEQIIKIEKHTNFIYGDLYYLNITLNVKYVDPKDPSTVKEINGIRMYGIESYKEFKNLNDIKKPFKNRFYIKIYYVVDITHTDDKFESDITFKANLQYMNVLVFKLNIDDEKYQSKIISYIHKKLNIEAPKSLEKIGRDENMDKETVFEAVLDNGKYKPGKVYKNDHILKNGYFYAKMTSPKEVLGEFLILINFEESK
ncbi:hypothetical protein SLITO_v1c01720 [Spiroplasma litorale]|uniref:Uncharacterized protein n=1 Tax=Spiroplasma litorale TaxID=216942 RepID=A0A0K1W168_9MOLU|nr:hypothetical protein [Spiroplasma litorale]AKX33837.1 hypothetical protein SLITO_v1c01720 [Spiroplasma litorale]